MIQDNRADWYTKTVDDRTANEAAWLMRFCAGQKIKARIQPKDLTLPRLLALGRTNVTSLASRRRSRA